MNINETGCWMDPEPAHLHDAKLAAALVTAFRGANAESVVDFGCGDGFYVKALLHACIRSWGFDGNPYIEVTHPYLHTHDLTKPIPASPGGGDWGLCLEVGEHIPKQFETTFIENICKASRTGIILSWAVPGQMGQGHVNEQPNDYIEFMMSLRGFRRAEPREMENLLREMAEFPWFKNTIMVYTRKAIHPKVNTAANRILIKAEVSIANKMGRLIEQAFQVCEMHDNAASISPASVSKALGSVKHVLVGGFAMPVHTKKPRATMDVDMVVGDVAKAEQAVAKAFPGLTKLANPGEDVTRYADEQGQEVINLLHPVGQFKVPLNFTVQVVVKGQSMKVASYEAMLVGKYLSSKSKHREDDRQKQDEADLSALFAARHDFKDWPKVEKVFQTLGGEPLAARWQTGDLRRLCFKSVKKKQDFDKRIAEARGRGERIISG